MPIALEDLPGRALVALLDQRAPAQLDRVHAERARRARPCAARAPSRPAARSGRGSSPTAGCSCRSSVRVDVDVLDLVRAARVHRRHLREEAAFAAVGALVERGAGRGGRRACRRARRPSRARSPCPRAGGRARRTPRGARRRASPAGRAARASAATCASKWKSHFAPKPPPSSGTMMRTFDSGIWRRVGDARARATNGTWVDVQTVTLSPCHSRDHRPRLDRDALRAIGHVAALHDDVGVGHAPRRRRPSRSSSSRAGCRRGRTSSSPS